MGEVCGGATPGREAIFLSAPKNNLGLPITNHSTPRRSTATGTNAFLIVPGSPSPTPCGPISYGDGGAQGVDPHRLCVNTQKVFTPCFAEAPKRAPGPTVCRIRCPQWRGARWVRRGPMSLSHKSITPECMSKQLYLQAELGRCELKIRPK